jgi:hypothetical protein
MVFEPDEADFKGMMELMESARKGDNELEGLGIGSGNGSFDGADQGLLNEWFSEEGGGGDWNRLSFTYVEPHLLVVISVLTTTMILQLQCDALGSLSVSLSWSN